MNGRKAKKIRKLIYKEDDYRKREYGQIKGRTQIVNIGQLESVGTVSNPKKVSKRRIYQHIKKLIRYCKIKDIEKEIFI